MALKCFEIHLQCNKLRHFPPVATKKISTLEVHIKKIEFERLGPIGQGCPAPQELTKSAGHGGGKLTIPTNFVWGGRDLFIWLFVQCVTVLFAERSFEI